MSLTLEAFRDMFRRYESAADVMAVDAHKPIAPPKKRYTEDCIPLFRARLRQGVPYDIIGRPYGLSGEKVRRLINNWK